MDRMRGRYTDLWQARLAKMTPEDLVAEVRHMAQQRGCPADLLPEDLDGALVWLQEQTQRDLAALPEAEREDLLARNPQYRDLLRP
ncbi:hypothetical protein Rumeso_03034 [Rubellimicrobium mesophilum DSM 19309]|uniref:Uncharacterized protein n=2 Tax=Rubellimicrobium TaxID=295418 RepID=A0A017HLK5_9RHOB|nr:hypothetical protein Rumeso_03034 [Rubellimicrobium mesophilum DSM 19309]